MSDSHDTKRTSIPSWQRGDVSSEPATPSSTVRDPTSPSLPEDPRHDSQRHLHASRASLLHTASNFLQDDDVRDAPIERKTAFLESKGLSSLEIEKLLAVSTSEIDPSCESKKQPVKDLQTDFTEPSQNDGNLKEIDKQSSQKSTSPHDIPPIITYPEFLIHTQKPPPLITANRLFTSLYLVTGVVTTIYGTSKYIVSPMVELLSFARHSLFDSANSNLRTLAEKLEQIVSLVPDTAASGKIWSQETDDSSTVSDPAESFHRSAATQTTPRLSRSISSISSQSAGFTTPTTDQHLHLQKLHAQLSDLQSSNDAQIDSSQQVKGIVNDLQNYLDSLAYGNLMTPIGLPGNSWNDDEISKVKAEIRSIKGVLLSARNFPSSVGGTKGRT
ncbi:hypothetical protein MMC07_003353 [Pseudocyphellaria aurata]|nr:hypothetical protein [Pseudocyphellaria aurata]